jgi:hypothetical protein
MPKRTIRWSRGPLLNDYEVAEVATVSVACGMPNILDEHTFEMITV